MQKLFSQILGWDCGYSSHQKALLLLPQDKKGYGSITSHEENWFVFSRSRLSFALINHQKGE